MVSVLTLSYSDYACLVFVLQYEVFNELSAELLSTFFGFGKVLLLLDPDKVRNCSQSLLHGPR